MPSRLETMTPEEAEAVLRLHLEEGGDPGAATVDDVAEALRLPPEEVRALLARVRSSGRKREKPTARRPRAFRNTLVAIGAVLVVGGIVANQVLAARSAQATQSLQSYLARRVLQFGDTKDGKSYGLDADGGAVHDYVQSFEEILNSHLSRREFDPATDARILRLVQKGVFDAPGIRHSPFKVYRNTRDGTQLRDAMGTLPVYEGNDARIERIVRRERERRITDALRAGAP